MTRDTFDTRSPLLSRSDVMDRTVYTSDGEKLGKVDGVLIDEAGSAHYIEVRSGWFGTRHHTVPLQGAMLEGDDLRVAYTKDQLEAAPTFEADEELDEDRERSVSSYYGIDSRYRDAGHDTSGPNTDDAMTRSEEELRVGTTRRDAGRVRLRKWVDTEPVSETVTTHRETAHVEREPITDANVGRATSGPDISEEEHELELTAEEAVVEKRAVPKERVRLEKDIVAEEQTVTDELRKERIEVEGDVTDERRR